MRLNPRLGTLMVPIVLIAACAPDGGAPVASGVSASSTPRPSASASADSGKASGSPAPTKPAPVTPEVVDHGPRSRNRVALTFDADLTTDMVRRLRAKTVGAQYDERIIRYLKKTGTPSTVFVTGLWAKEYPDALRELARDPLFEIGNHTWDHLAWTDSCYGLPQVTDPRKKRAEVRETADLLAATTGRYPRFFRFPGLCHTEGDVKIVADEGETVVDWDIGTSDAFGTDGAAVARGILSEIRPGSVVVMHLNGAPNAGATYDAVRLIVPGLRAKGLTPVTLSQLVSSNG